MNSLSTGPEREVENDVTTDIIVLSLTHVNQRLADTAKPKHSDNHPSPGGIVRSILCIRQLFEDVVRTSKSIQKDYPDVADLVPKIQIQQVAFDNGCKRLLGTAVKSRQDLNNMIEDRRHPIWEDTIAHRDFDTLMARFHLMCLAALAHFQESLSELKAGLHTLRGQGKKKALSRYRFWQKGSSSPNFGTTEEFPKFLQNLRNYNDVFCTLIWQAVPHRSGYRFGTSFREDLGRSYPVRAGGASHYHLGCIQRASQALYDTLSNVWTCRDHEAHSLNISLKFDYAKADAAVRSEEFCFNVAVTSPCFESLYRLIFDTAHGEFCTYQSVGDARSPKTTYVESRVVGPAAWTKPWDSSELDADIAARRAADQGTRTLERAESLQEDVPDLGLQEDLCSWLRSLSVTIEPKQETRCSWIGFFETRNERRFRLSCVVRDEYQKQGSHSLDDVLLRANNERREIPLEDRLRTALSLAAGVLHLSTSSWLRQAWSSKDVQFLNMDDYDRCTLGEPFLQIELDSKTPREPVYDVEKSAATRSCLLSLGLVLIELAFSAPWRKLQLQENITENLLPWERSLFNLMRLSDTVSRELGSTYAKVVQTCLFQGLEAKETHALQKAELDEVIFEDIVRELYRCLSAVTFQSGMYSNS